MLAVASPQRRFRGEDRAVARKQAQSLQTPENRATVNWQPGEGRGRGGALYWSAITDTGANKAFANSQW